MSRRPTVKSIETRHDEERDDLFRQLRRLDRRAFLKVSLGAAAAVAAKGLFHPHSFMPIDVAYAATPEREGFRIAYISDSHLYDRTVNDRFVRQLLRAVDDVNHLDPQPDFVLFGGDLAQLGRPGELDLGSQILKNLKPPVHMMVGEHDWYFDMGEKWRALFGEPTYSFDHKGVHFVVLNSVIEKDFWTDDAEQVQAILKPFNHVTVIHGHTHQLLTNRIGNIAFHGMLSTAWPWPYAPQGLPALTVQMNRPDPFDPNDGLGNGEVRVHPDGLVDKVYNLWNRNPVQVSAAYVTSGGKQDPPAKPNLVTF